MPKGYSMGGNLPAAKESNGLPDHIEDFISDDTHTILAVVEIGVNYSKKPRGSDELEPVLQITYVEPIVGRSDVAELSKIAGRVFTARTGQAVRPKRDDAPDPSSVPLDLPPTLSGEPPVTEPAKKSNVTTLPPKK